jgi:hypothetical protein
MASCAMNQTLHATHHQTTKPFTSTPGRCRERIGDYFAQLLLGPSQVKAVNTFLTNPSKFTGKIPTTQDALDMV